MLRKRSKNFLTVDEFLEDSFNKLGEVPYFELVNYVKKNLLANAYEERCFKVDRAAKLLNLRRTTLTEMLQQYGLHVRTRQKRKIPQP